MKVTYHLFSPAVTVFEDALDPRKRMAGGTYEEVSRSVEDIDFEYKVYVEMARSKTPDWVQFLRPYVQPGMLDEVKNTGSSFVVIMKVPDGAEGFRFFAITGGQGGNFLNKDLLEHDFGLITALNAIDPNQIKQIAANAIEAKSPQRRMSTRIGVDVPELGVDLDHEIIRSVSGLGDGMLEGMIQGGSSLQLSGKVSFGQLGDQCKVLLERYGARDYRERFGAVNGVVPVRSRMLKDLLTEVVVQKINNRSEDIAIAYPHRFDDDRWQGVTVAGLGNTVTQAMFDREALFACLDGSAALTVEGLRSLLRVRTNDGLDEEVGGRSVAQPVYNFLVTSVDHEGARYVLSGREWHRVTAEYTADIDEIMQGVDVVDFTGLPGWRYGEGVPLYVASLPDNGEWVRLNTISTSGKRLPMPDLYHVETQSLVFARPLYRSATHSPVFTRGQQVIERLRMDGGYRTLIANELARQGSVRLPERLDDLSIVYLFGVPRDAALLEAMPLFTRVNLIRHARAMQRLGCGVKVGSVQMGM